MPIIASARTRRALLLTLLLGALPGTASAAPGPGAPVPVLDWHDCDGGFQCATATVPRDHARPLGPTIDLALIRFRAVDQEHRIGTPLPQPGRTRRLGCGSVRTAPPFALGLLATASTSSGSTRAASPRARRASSATRGRRCTRR